MLKEGQIRIPSGCAIAAIIDRKGGRINGSEIIKSIALMHDRSNGLGGGFAAYGIYPDHAEDYAFHVFYDKPEAKVECEDYLFKHFNVDVSEKIPTKKIEEIANGPDIWRYFAKPNKVRMKEARMDEEEYTVQCVMKVNQDIDGAFIFSSGKNMGCFKAVGFPEDVGEFYMLDQYDAYLWTAHGRFLQILPDGGAALIRSIFLTGLLFITVKYHPMMPTEDILSSSATFAQCRRIQRLLHIFLTIFSVTIIFRLRLRQTCLLLPSGRK